MKSARIDLEKMKVRYNDATLQNSPETGHRLMNDKGSGAAPLLRATLSLLFPRHIDLREKHMGRSQATAHVVQFREGRVEKTPLKTKTAKTFYGKMKNPTQNVQYIQCATRGI
ncbi:hypothetical protein CBL_09323 [Carabus blaptoides fortunei]